VPDGGDALDAGVADTAGDAAVDAAGSDTGDGPPDTTVARPFPFRPSNIAIEQLRLSSVAPQLADVVLDSNDCKIDNFETPKVITCTVAPSSVAPLAGVVWMAVRIGDDPPADVFIARSWVISNRAALPVNGRTVLVALGDIVVAGALTAAGADTAEPGAGSGGDATAGGGGGSFCGHGGVGSHSTQPLGMTYGTPDLVPPRVGSSGGGLWTSSAGGFLHLLAGGKVTVTASGRVSAPGGGGYSFGGGGSGGAVLIEATSIAIHGVVAANGGGGGGALARAMGEPGAASAVAAGGGLDDDGSVIGGAGGAGTSIDGQNGVATAASAGGGGSVGRIRLNTRSQQLTVDGALSPPLSTACASAGLVQDP
jgi:hypothetical protein